jgi:cytochrome c oxidase assembly protein subunit 15
MHSVTVSWLRSPRTLRYAAAATIAANVGIVISGGAVRLTGSGLGCPTWPTCTADSFVPSQALGIHAAIEYGNRMFSFVVTAVGIFAVVVAFLQRPRRRRVTRLSLLALAGIPAQGVLGGLTVLTGLNPWMVGAHFMVSIGVLAAAYAFWRSTVEPDGPALVSVPAPLRTLTFILVIASAAVLVVGTIVTGSGPHAGDADVTRNGLDPRMITQVHADLVFLVIGLAVAAMLAFRAVDARPAFVRAAWLLAILLAQGAVGFVQYATNLPVALVAAHMAGACAVWLSTLTVLYATRTRAALPSPTPALASTAR